MKFNVEGRTFQQQIQAVSKVMNSKNTISMLNNFLFEVEGDRLSITASDQENTLTAFMEITESECDGSICIDARRLLDITKEVGNQPLTFVVNDTTKEIDLQFLNGHFDFMGYDAADFPRERKLEAEPTEIVLHADIVTKGIGHTLFAVSTESSRPVMTGIFWDIHPDDVTFVSSDTHKLVKYVNSERALGIESSFIMPPKTAGILRSLITKDDAEIKITYDSKGGIFEFGDYVFTSLFIKGRYPDYNRVIPANNPFALTVDRVSLINALRRVTLFASKSSNLVALQVSDNEIVINSSDMDYQTKAEEHIVCSYEGNPMVIGFNGVFMIGILSNLSCDSIAIELCDPSRPCVVTPLEKEEGQDIRIIQMPMQVI